MFSGRGRRVAACTALALSAGMLLATPASADDATSAARAFAEKRQASADGPKKTLSSSQAGSTRAGALAAQAVSPLLSDLDGDGVDDVIYRDEYGFLNAVVGDVTWPFGDFEAPVAKDVIPIGNQGGGALPEVLTVSETGTLTLYKDNSEIGSVDANDNYRPGVRVGGGWQVYNKIASPGDVNGDGRADVIARTHGGQLYLYIATGDLTKPLGGRILVGSGWGVYDQLVGLGDGNGDGRADLYARDTAGTLWFYSGTGDKAKPFATRKSIGGGWNAYTQIVAGGHGSLRGRDLNGTMYFYAPNGNGTLAPRVKEGETGAWKDAAQIANAGSIPYLGRDGVHALTPGGSWYWYQNTTTGRLAARETVDNQNSFPNDNLFGLSSMDDDGMSDLGHIVNGYFFVNGGLIGGGWGIYNSVVGPGDLSGDGKGDLIARDRSGVLWLYKGNGLGTAFSTRVKVGSGWGVYNKIIGAGDYTGDGRTDLVARTTTGDLYVYPGTGNATTPFKTRVKVGSGWNTFKQLASPGDLNADGKGDLIGVNGAGELYRYLNTSPSKFAPAAKIGTGFQIYNRIG
ncbi:VCBS repeat-containing protein [Streptomyces sp. CC208A]|uniref:FG-GAP repeat domain-containing protein n=1 Tax=Streptomyces sp. CC208A TaxID=3044573 RepID=UPI0024A7E7FA|nr:VCBS repeat-containing protein [Streptomyces sp. CC208A]